MDIDEIRTREIVDEELEKRGLDMETSLTHRTYINHLISEGQKKEQRREKFKLSVIGSVATLCVAGLAWIGQFVVTLIINYLHNPGDN